MDKFTLTLAAATMAELYASAAAFANSGGNLAPFVTAPSDDDEGGPVNTAAPALDAEGVPWDAEIHSSNKQMTDKGVWRRKRGVHDTTYATVTARLKAQAGVNAVTAAAPQPAPMPTPAAMPMPTAAPQPAPMPTPAPAAAPQPSPGGSPFGEFMAKYSAAVNAGKVTQAELMSFINAYGVPDLPTLNTRPDVIEQLTTWMLANGKL